jgi:uncharacterized protein (TIGR02594 family)
MAIDETISTLPVPRNDEPPWLSIARGELGVHETPGPAATERVLEYHAATTLRASSDEVPWCSAFACWCMERAGFRSTRSASARSWLTWRYPLAELRPGCVVVLSRGDASLGQGHVGFFAGYSRLFVMGPRRLLLLGGNQGNAVSLAPYPQTRVIGMRWPTLDAG